MKPRPSLGLALLCLGLGACEERAPIPSEELRLTLVGPSEPVTTGKAFPLTVVQVWSKALPVGEMLPLEGRVFAPLVARLEESERRESATHVEVTGHYRAYALTRTDVTVPPVTWEVSSGPELDLKSTTPPLRVRVRPELDAAQPGEPEIPDELLAEAENRLPWAVACTVLLLAVATWIGRRHRARVGATEPTPPAPLPGPEAFLARLRAIEAGDPAQQVLALAALLREEVALRLGVPTESRTSPETLHALSATHVPLHVVETLKGVLHAADLVKYGAHRPRAEEAADLRAAAEACVRAGSVR